MEAIEQGLRERVLHALDVEGQSRAEVSRRFAVSYSWVGKLLGRRRADGSTAPRPHAGGAPPKLPDPGVLRALVAEQPDATREELAERLRERHGVALHPGSVSRHLRRLGLSLKKKSFTRASGRRSG